MEISLYPNELIFSYELHSNYFLISEIKSLYLITLTFKFWSKGK